MITEIGNYTILEHHYYCDNPLAFAIVALEKLEGTWTGRISLIVGVNEKEDLLITAQHGSKLTKPQALAFFPELDADKCLN